MSTAHTADTRDRLQMEALRERAERIKSVSGVTREQLVEDAFKRGVEFQKNNPSPKAKLYRDALREVATETKRQHENAVKLQLHSCWPDCPWLAAIVKADAVLK